jgi:hypothetical protein
MTTVKPAEQLLADIAAQGIELQAYGDQLRFRPAGALTPELIQQLRIHKTELLARLSNERTPPWDQAEADRLLSELQEEVERLRRELFAGKFPKDLDTVVKDGLDIAASYIRNHEEEAARGWDPLELLRGVLPWLRKIIERASGRRQTTQ